MGVLRVVGMRLWVYGWDCKWRVGVVRGAPMGTRDFSRRLDDFMAALAEAKLKLILNVRLKDERHNYFALRMECVQVSDIAAFLRRFSSHNVLLTGAYKQEIWPLLVHHANFSFDITFCEAFKTLETLLEKIPPPSHARHLHSAPLYAWAS